MSRLPFVLSVALTLFFGTISACGVKAPPSMPPQDFFLKIEALQGEWKDGDLYLSGVIKESDEALNLVEGCRLYYAGYSSKAQPCSGCPIDYHGFHDFGSEVVSLQGLMLKVPKKQMGQVSFFKVHLIGPKGAVGPSSNTVRIDAEQD